jgi:hypothetical protein
MPVAVCLESMTRVWVLLHVGQVIDTTLWVVKDATAGANRPSGGAQGERLARSDRGDGLGVDFCCSSKAAVGPSPGSVLLSRESASGASQGRPLRRFVLGVVTVVSAETPPFMGLRNSAARLARRL